MSMEKGWVGFCPISSFAVEQNNNNQGSATITLTEAFQHRVRWYKITHF